MGAYLLIVMKLWPITYSEKDLKIASFLNLQKPDHKVDGFWFFAERFLMLVHSKLVNGHREKQTRSVNLVRNFEINSRREKGQ